MTTYSANGIAFSSAKQVDALSLSASGAQSSHQNETPASKGALTTSAALECGQSKQAMHLLVVRAGENAGNLEAQAFLQNAAEEGAVSSYSYDVWDDANVKSHEVEILLALFTGILGAIGVIAFVLRGVLGQSYVFDDIGVGSIALGSLAAITLLCFCSYRRVFSPHRAYSYQQNHDRTMPSSIAAASSSVESRVADRPTQNAVRQKVVSIPNQMDEQSSSCQEGDGILLDQPPPYGLEHQPNPNENTPLLQHQAP